MKQPVIMKHLQQQNDDFCTKWQNADKIKWLVLLGTIRQNL